MERGMEGGGMMESERDRGEREQERERERAIERKPL